jgi:hypothetical protein
MTASTLFDSSSLTATGRAPCDAIAIGQLVDAHMRKLRKLRRVRQAGGRDQYDS